MLSRDFLILCHLSAGNKPRTLKELVNKLHKNKLPQPKGRVLSSLSRLIEAGFVDTEHVNTSDKGPTKLVTYYCVNSQGLHFMTKQRLEQDRINNTTD